uniref:carboxypeptidase-like regulatory domain-containing protein n=1 Tax=Mariniflexile sp. TaxID=1979402 RepID=UPI00404897A2
MKLSLLFVSIFCIASVYGQKWSIKLKKASGVNAVTINGKNVDGLNNPLASAHIILTNIETNKQAKTISQDDGSFLLKTTAGDYYLSISMLGFEKYAQKLTITTNINLGTIVLNEEITALNEVVLQQNINKKITQMPTI